jgi:hypothetical protein
MAPWTFFRIIEGKRFGTICPVAGSAVSAFKTRRPFELRPRPSWEIRTLAG